MQASLWLSRVRESLRENGIPERQQQRFLEELQDHLTDMQEANMNQAELNDFEKMMGPPDSLGQALAEEYHCERRLSRHPWLATVAFLFGPMAMQWALTLPMGFAIASVAAVFSWVTEDFSWAFGVAGGLSAIAVSAWFSLAARRNRLSWRFSQLAAISAGFSIASIVLLEPEFLETEPWAVVLVSVFPPIASLLTWYFAAIRAGRWQTKATSFSARFPVVAGLTGGLVASAWCLVTFLVVAGLAFELLGVSNEDPHATARWMKPFALSCQFVPFLLAALACWRLTRRCKRQVACSLAACLSVAVLAGLFFANIIETPEGPMNYQFAMGFGLRMHWMTVVQFLVPAAVWAGLMAWSKAAFARQKPEIA